MEPLPPDGGSRGYVVGDYRFYLVGIGGLVFDVEVAEGRSGSPRC